MRRITTYITRNGVKEVEDGGGTCVIEASVSITGNIDINGYPVAIDESVLYVSEWHINALMGDDTNVGTSADHALKTH